MLLYEPRAFWSLARVDTSQEQPRPPFTVRLPANDFLNGEKYPVTLTKALVAPINYTFSRYSDANPLTAANFRNCGAAAVEQARVVISAPQRQYYLRNPGHPQVTTPRPSDTPNNPGVAFGTPDYASSLWGLTRWQFDKPMIIPKLGDLEFDLSSYSVPPGVLVPPFAAATVHFEEAGGNLFGGNARQSGFLPLAIYNTVTGGTPPFPVDGFGAFGPAYAQLATWPSDQRFTAKRYAAENPSSDGSIPVTGFNVMIDQQIHDDRIAGQIPSNPGSVVSPLSLRVAARARMRNGGTGSWWWRQGAPLALVCPTITPAQVYDLPEPITLGPGDRLDLEVSTPGPTVITVEGEPVIVNSVYQLGVSLCGYASIEA
jgi:hypothetical protein